MRTGGIFGLVASNSNDLAFGIPVIAALFPPSETGGIPYEAYLYVATAIQMGTLNFLGFLMMELGNSKMADKVPGSLPSKSVMRTVIRLVVSTLTNKVILMTLLGLVYHAIFGKPPKYISSLMTTLGNAFPCGALFLLGMSLNNDVSIKGRALVWPTYLVFSKVLLMPMLMRLMTTLLHMPSLPSDFLFIYGSFPTPPAVYLFALEYGSVSLEVVSACIVLSTIVFSPVAFATTILISDHNKENLFRAIGVLVTGCNIASVAGCSVILVMFALLPRWRRFPLNHISHFALCRLVVSGIRLWGCDYEHGGAKYVASQTFRYASRIWIPVIAANLVLIAARGRAAAMRLRYVYLVAVYGVSLATAVGLTLAHGPESRNPKNALTQCVYHYGRSQYVLDIASFSLFLIIVASSIAVVEHIHLGGRKVPRDLTEWGLFGRDGGSSVPLLTGVADPESGHGGGGSSAAAAAIPAAPLSPPARGASRRPSSTDIRPSTELVAARSSTRHLQYQTMPAGFASAPAAASPAVSAAIAGDDYGEEGPDDLARARTGAGGGQASDKFRIEVFLTLCCIGLLSQLIVAISFARRPDDPATYENGTVLEVSAMSALFTDGIGITLALVFATDKRVSQGLGFLVRAVRIRIRTAFFGVEPVAMSMEPVDEGTVPDAYIKIIEGVRAAGLLQDRTYLFKTYPNCFVGSELVSWCVRTGMALDREEAVLLGKDMMARGILHHFTNEHNFHDKGYFYVFHEDLKLS